VDEAAKEKLSKEIYAKRRAEVGHLVGPEEDSSREEDDLLDFEPIEPGRKWRN